MTKQQQLQKEYQIDLKKQARKLLSYRFHVDMQFIPIKETRSMFVGSNRIAKEIIKLAK
jgi:hypothetical protein